MLSLRLLFASLSIIALATACSSSTAPNLTGCTQGPGCPTLTGTTSCTDGTLTTCFTVGSENQNCPDVRNVVVTTMKCDYGCAATEPTSEFQVGCNVVPDAGTDQCSQWCDAGDSPSCNTCSDGAAITCADRAPRGSCNCAGPPATVRKTCASGCDDAGIACASSGDGG